VHKNKYYFINENGQILIWFVTNIKNAESGFTVHHPKLE